MKFQQFPLGGDKAENCLFKINRLQIIKVRVGRMLLPRRSVDKSLPRQFIHAFIQPSVHLFIHPSVQSTKQATVNLQGAAQPAGCADSQTAANQSDSEPTAARCLPHPPHWRPPGSSRARVAQPRTKALIWTVEKSLFHWKTTISGLYLSKNTWPKIIGCINATVTLQLWVFFYTLKWLVVQVLHVRTNLAKTAFSVGAANSYIVLHHLN